MRVLAATDFSTRSHRALRRAGILARSRNAELIIVHVVDDDQPLEMFEADKREAQKYLDEQLVATSALGDLDCSVEVVAGDPFAGILQAAEAHAVDLIVMGSHRKHLLRDIFVGTTIERVVRTGPYPVLMVNAEMERAYEKVMAAADMSESSARAIKTATELGLTGNAGLTLVHGFDAFAKGKMASGWTNGDEIDIYVAQERLRAGTELVAFLEANNFGVDEWSLRVKEAGAVEAIMDAVQELAPDLLVMGTHGRSRIVKILLGSVTETVLRSVDIDVLVVPQVRK